MARIFGETLIVIITFLGLAAAVLSPARGSSWYEEQARQSKSLHDRMREAETDRRLREIERDLEDQRMKEFSDRLRRCGHGDCF